VRISMPVTIATPFNSAHRITPHLYLQWAAYIALCTQDVPQLEGRFPFASVVQELIMRNTTGSSPREGEGRGVQPSPFGLYLPEATSDAGAEQSMEVPRMLKEHPKFDVSWVHQAQVRAL
jgi:hypothetical protein